MMCNLSFSTQITEKISFFVFKATNPTPVSAATNYLSRYFLLLQSSIAYYRKGRVTRAIAAHMQSEMHHLIRESTKLRFVPFDSIYDRGR